MKTTHFTAVRNLVIGVFFILVSTPSFAASSDSEGEAAETQVWLEFSNKHNYITTVHRSTCNTILTASVSFQADMSSVKVASCDSDMLTVNWTRQDVNSQEIHVTLPGDSPPPPNDSTIQVQSTNNV